MQGLRSVDRLRALGIAAAGALLAAGRAVPAGLPAAPTVLDAIRVVAFDDDASAAEAARDFGSCRVLIWITLQGTVQAAQVINSSGAANFDQACVQAVIGQQLAPAAVQGVDVDSWAVLPIILAGKGPLADKEAALKRPERPIPSLMPTQSLHLRPPFYPAEAVARGEQGGCTVHVEVSAAGVVGKIGLTRSSGSALLDAACLDVVRAARFTPAARAGQPVAAGTDIALLWRLPAAAANTR